MQVGRHYAITVRGTTYYTVCLGFDDTSYYLKDVNGFVLEIPVNDTDAFKTVTETNQYQDKLTEICNKELDLDLDTILQEAFEMRKLVTSDIPLNMIEKLEETERMIAHLQTFQETLMQLDHILNNRKKMYEEQLEEQTRQEREEQLTQQRQTFLR